MTVLLISFYLSLDSARSLARVYASFPKEQSFMLEDDDQLVKYLRESVNK